MKLSKDLYDAGILRRQRTGPSNDWGFDEPNISFGRIGTAIGGLLRYLFAGQRGQGVRDIGPGCGQWESR